MEHFTRFKHSIASEWNILLRRSPRFWLHQIGKTFKTLNSKQAKFTCRTVSLLLSTPFKLWDCIFHFLSVCFISLLPTLFLTYPLYKNNNNKINNLRYKFTSLHISSFISLFKLSVLHPFINHPPSFPASACFLFFVVAKLDGEPVAHAAKCRWLHLPVIDRVREQADAIIECPLHPKSTRTEVIHTHLADVVGMEINHLKKKAHWQRRESRREHCENQCQIENKIGCTH